MQNDTICGISTPLSSGAISIIRVSGDEAIEIVNSIFVGKNLTKVDSNTINYGHIKDIDIIDEVLVSVMRSPKTYTMEDVVEINCHGGIYVTNRVLELLLSKGCRIANPGEFSLRAFLNGRIDLTQAESIMDIINAKNEKSLKLANKGLNGNVKRMVDDLRNRIVKLIANIEVNIDYPEYDDAIIMSNEIIKPEVLNIVNEIDKTLEKARSGKIIREGIKTAIIGKPNVGKSSLLNHLLEEEKAIVTDIAGTTRDLVEGYINLKGITLNLIDTAGIRNTSDVVEKIGVDKSIKIIDEASLIIVLLDNSNDLSIEDREILDLTKDKTRIIIANKADLDKKLNYEVDLEISVKEEINIDGLEDVILKKLDLDIDDEMNYMSNTRHISLLKIAKDSLIEAINSIDIEMPVDMVEIDLKNAWDSLGSIIGDISNDSLLNELFSNFCLGK